MKTLPPYSPSLPRHRCLPQGSGLSKREVALLDALVSQWESRLRDATRLLHTSAKPEGLAVMRSLADEMAGFQADLSRTEKENRYGRLV